MDDLFDSDLQEIYSKSAAPANDAANVEEAAAAAETTETASEEIEVETNEAESAEEPKETPEGESETPADEEETEETSDSPDDFQDLLDDIPSKEAILKKHNRVPNSAKDDLVMYADNWRADREKLNSIGGEQGAEVLKPIADLLTKPDIQPDDTFGAWSTIVTTNPTAAHQLLVDGATNLLFTTENDPFAREMAKKGDAVLQSRFGEGVTAEHIEKLVMLEKGGVIDLDNDMAYLQSEGKDSTLFQSQAEKIAELTTKLEEATNLVKNPHLIERQTASSQNAVKELDTELNTRISAGITPFRERGRWPEESALTKIVTKALMSELKESGEYKEAVKFVSQYGSLKQGDVIPYPVESKLYALVSKAKGKFGQDVIAVNADLRKLQEGSRNVEVQKEVKETKPKAVVVAPTAKVSNGMFPDELEEIYAKTDALRLAKAG